MNFIILWMNIRNFYYKDNNASSLKGLNFIQIGF